MILLDATSLMLLVHPDADPPIDPTIGQAVERVGERFAYLEQEVQRQGETIVVPTPALAEVLVGLEDGGPEILERISRSSRFEIADFDQRAAVEVAAMTRDAIRAGDKRGGSDADWQKVKYDRQIIAIARVRQVSAVYSDDKGVRSFGERIGMKVIPTWAMPLPPEPNQRSLFNEYESKF